MAASAALSNLSDQSGMRSVNLSTDLGGLADLLELCFGNSMDDAGRAIIRELRLLSKGGRLLGILNQFDRILGNLQQGFVWLDEGRIVGNTTLSPAPVPREVGIGSIISNVAVHPDFRRRGIAKALVEASLDLARVQRRQFALLQVDAVNESAQQLYKQLGFRVERAFTHWRRTPYQRIPQALRNMPSIWRRPGNDWKAEFELATLVRPNWLGGMGWLRPTQSAMFRRGLLSWLGMSLSSRADEEYVVYRNVSVRERLGLLASARLQMQFGGADRLDLLVHPDAFGKLEDPLVNFIIRLLEHRRRNLICEHPTDDAAATEVFRKYGFEPKQTSLNMRLDFVLQGSKE